MFHRGDLPVTAVTTTTHCPDDKGERHGLSEDDGGEGGAPQKGIVAKSGQGSGEGDGRECFTAAERPAVYLSDFVGECEGGEEPAAAKCLFSNSF